MRIVVIGNGKVGFALCAQLSREGHDLVVIDKKKSDATSESLDVLTVSGNGAMLKTQMEAGVDKADLLIACTPSDEVNLLCCIVARHIGCKKTIARVRDPDYDQQFDLIRNDLGISFSINPERITAGEIFNMLRFPSFLNMDIFAGGKLQIVEIQLGDNSSLVGKTLMELKELDKLRVLICAVQRGKEEVTIPSGRFRLEAGDRVFATAPTYNLHKLVTLMGVEMRRISDVLIIGGGRISSYLASYLLREGFSVKIIDKSEERCHELVETLPKAIIIHGDGTDQKVLLSEGIKDMDAVVTLTNMDEENLIVSMYANFLGVQRVITKINRTEYSEVFQDKGIESVVSPKDLIIDKILSFVRSFHNAEPDAMLSLHRIGNGAAEAMEFIATSSTKYLGEELNNIRLKSNLLVACIIRRSTIIVPRGQDTIEKGDRVYIVADSDHMLRDINDIFEV